VAALEPEDVVAAWKRWSPILLRPEGLYGTRPAEGRHKAVKLKAIREALRSAKRVWLATDCDREGQSSHHAITCGRPCRRLGPSPRSTNSSRSDPGRRPLAVAFLSEEFLAYRRRQRLRGSVRRHGARRVIWPRRKRPCLRFCRHRHARPAQFFETCTDHGKIVSSAGRVMFPPLLSRALLVALTLPSKPVGAPLNHAWEFGSTPVPSRRRSGQFRSYFRRP
jgi:hypothetical protein